MQYYSYFRTEVDLKTSLMFIHRGRGIFSKIIELKNNNHRAVEKL